MERDPAVSRSAAVLAVIFTPVVWPVGVVLLWLSAFWNRRDKLIGTLLLPGGLLGAVLIETQVRSNCQLTPAGVVVSCTPGPLYQLLHPGTDAFNHVFGALIFAAFVGLPLLSAGYLAFRLRESWMRVGPMPGSI